MQEKREELPCSQVADPILLSQGKLKISGDSLGIFLAVNCCHVEDLGC